MTPDSLSYAYPNPGERIVVCPHVDLYSPHSLHWFRVEPSQRCELNGQILEFSHVALCRYCARLHARNPYLAVTDTRVWNPQPESPVCLDESQKFPK